MKRLFALAAGAALAAALAVAPSFDHSGAALAQGSSSGSGAKSCKAKTPEGKIKKWRCGKDQACCSNPALGIYVCGYPGLGCL